jgi:hypothetical protein
MLNYAFLIVSVPLFSEQVVVRYPKSTWAILNTLKNEVAKHYEQGLSDFEMSPLVIESLGDYHDWVDFQRNVGRHISLAYLEVEAELF